MDKGQNYEDFYGKERAKEIKRKIGLKSLNRKFSKQRNEKISKCMKGNKYRIGKSPWNKGIKGVLKSYNKINFSKNQKERIINLYESNLLNAIQIGKRFGCSNTPIIRVLKEENINLSPRIRLKKLYAKGLIKRNGGTFKKGHKSWNKGKHLPEETKRKISLKNKGRVISKETKLKIGRGNKGKRISEEIKNKISVSLKGHKSWNKGLKTPLEVRIKIGRGNKGKKRSIKTRNLIKLARAKQVLPVKDTKIEVKIQNFLSLLHLEFYIHKYIHINHGYQCDILIPKQETGGIIVAQKTIIEVDGCYWHGCKICKVNENKELTERQKKQIENDSIRTKEQIGRASCRERV